MVIIRGIKTEKFHQESIFLHSLLFDTFLLRFLEGL